MTLAEGLRDAIMYIEENLTNEISIKDIAKQAYVSEFYFQHIFSALCNFSVAEYIRNRRLTLAGRELAGHQGKVIDIALKYGYDSPDSFTRAFTKFHGITPSAAREKGAMLKDFVPLRIKISLKGGTMMNYRIEEKAAFTVIGKKKNFTYETAYQEVPKFWQEHKNGEDGKLVKGSYGLAMDSNPENFDYYIADNYQPWKKIPEGFEAITLPAGTWAIFPCTMASLQETSTKMWEEWVPNCKDYDMGGNYSIEFYLSGDKGCTPDCYCEVWMPIKAKKN